MRKFLKATCVAVALFSLLGNAAEAATTPNSIVTPQVPNRGVVQFLQGTDAAGTYKTLYTGGANASKCSGIWTNNNDTSATHLITVQIVNNGVKYGGVSLTSVVNAGFVNGTPPQSLLSTTLWPGLPLDTNSTPFLILSSGDTLQATYATTLTSADLINVVAVCTDY